MKKVVDINYIRFTKYLVGVPKEENEDNRHIFQDTIRNKTSEKKNLKPNI